MVSARYWTEIALGAPVKNFNIFDPGQWSDVHGFVILMLVIAGTILGTIMKLIGNRWNDWLDEAHGRGSIEDEWLLDGLEQRRRSTASTVRANGASGPPRRS